MRKHLLITGLFISVFGHLSHAHGHDKDHNHGNDKPASLSQKIHFIENKGQWEHNVRYKADIPHGGMVLYTTDGFFFNYVSIEDRARIHDMEHNGASQSTLDKEKVRGHAYKVNFVGRNASNPVKTSERRSFYQNYFMGNNPSKWQGNVGLFGGIEEKNVYNGIDIKLYSSEKNNLKYDFVVAPGANPNQIQLSFDGITPKITKDGQLLIKTSFNEFYEAQPYTYQVIDNKKVTVASKYVLNEGVLSFAFPEGYNKGYPLVIDPELIFATYSGATGTVSFFAQATSYDLDGNMYVAALSSGVGWPVTTGAYQTAYGGGGHDIAINKYSPDGVNLIFSTYLGGSANDLATSIRTNPAGDFYVVGQSASADYPITTNAAQGTFAGGTCDLIVTHINAAGNGLIGSTFIGGNAAEGTPIEGTVTGAPVQNGISSTGPVEIIIDNAGDVIVVSNTHSSNFPVSANAVQGTFGGGTTDGVIFKLNPTLTTLIYSSYIGGNGTDAAFDVKLNNANEVIVCGQTNSTNFNVGSGGFKGTHSGGIDGWVLRFSPTFGQLSGTFLGTSNDDHASKISIDCNDNVYVAGRSANGTYPVSTGVYSMPNGSVYIQKLNNTLSNGMLSTVVGPPNTGLHSGGYIVTGFMVDICGLVYVSGVGASGTLPTTPDAFQVNQAPFYGLVLEPNFGDLYFATYYGVGGAHQHTGNSHMDPEGRVYQSMCYSGGSFPVYPANVFAPTQGNSGLDMVSFKFDFEANPVKIGGETPEGGGIPNNHAIRGCKSAFIHYSRSADPEPMIIRYEILGDAINGVDYQWIPDSIIIQPNDDSATLEIKALLANSATGPRRVIINTFSPCACEGDTKRIVSTDTVIILDSLYVSLPIKTDTTCPNDLVTIVADMDPTLIYEWQPANLIQDASGRTINVNPTVTTNYSVTVRQPGAPNTCPPRTATYRAYVEPYPIISFPNDIQTICLSNDSFPLVAYVEPAGINYLYTWSPTTYLRDATTPINKFYAPVGNYVMKVRISTPGAGCTSNDSLVINVVPPFEFLSVSPMDTTIKLGQSVPITTVSDAVMWYWTPMEYLNDPMIPNPIASPKENTRYQLIGFDQYGCQDTVYVNVNVTHKPDIYIPNAFSPNGDGVNDVLKIVNMKYERLVSFRVFNRLGKLVFETQDPLKGWDGMIEGKPAPSDVYMYHVLITPPLELKPIEYKGDVTLIR